MPALAERPLGTVELWPECLRPVRADACRDLLRLEQITAAVTEPAAVTRVQVADLRLLQPTDFFDGSLTVEEPYGLFVQDPTVTSLEARDDLRHFQVASVELAALTRTWGLLRNRMLSASPAVVDSSRLAAKEAPSPASHRSRSYGQFVELASWLDMSRGETADLLGIGRTTPSAWERDGREPRPRRARRLYQTHALVGALIECHGTAETRRWLITGRPAPLKLIADGRLDLAEDRAQKLIYGAPAGAAGPIDVARPPAPEQVPPVSAVRPVARRRLVSSASRRTGK